MRILKLFTVLAFAVGMTPCFASSMFFPDEKIQDGLPVFEMSENFADVYEKLNSVKWGGKNLNVAIESLENLNPYAHIAATDERVVLVWDDKIIANYPRPEKNDWNAFGEITTALILKMRANDAHLKSLTENETYQYVVDAIMRGLDENGRYIFSKSAQITEDGRLLTSVGMEGTRDERGNFRVDGVFKDAPADTAGISSGDLIVQINGKLVRNMSDSELASVLSGFNSGTSKIKILSPSGSKDVVLRRATVVVADADIVHRSNADDGGILEIVVHKISDGAVDIIKNALHTYSDVNGVILDLRTSTGDDERAAAKLAGLFVGDVPVMRIVETAMDEVEVVPNTSPVSEAPVVVLMSDQTRGTAEAVAYAFYEIKRGVLVGTPTAGNARIATVIDLDNGGALELLNKSVKSGQGSVIDGRGVFPIVCLSNIRSSQQQNAFFLNVINGDFNGRDFNKEKNVNVKDIRQGCPTIASGVDEDALSMAVSVKILTDMKIYNRLIDL
ncbi:MAG: PDZ domain-containing protein [Alphaproteobacteria bacterium]|nr:PDZ domain-containing protein [Alphaproteobacteria bacterium]